MVDLFDEVTQHFLGDFKIGDHAVSHRSNGHDVARGATQHRLGITSHRQDVIGAFLH